MVERSATFDTFSWTPAHEKSRQGGVVRDAAVLSAYGGGLDDRRILGVSVAVSESEVPDHGVLGRAFLEDLVRRGMRGVEFITSDDHAGLPSRHLGRPQARAGRRRPSAIC